MFNQEGQEMAEQKKKIMTGFIHYGKSDDLIEIFKILNDFRKNNGLKYTHQSIENKIFFNISSEHLNSFSKKRPFKISKYQTKSEYKCDKDISNKLMSLKDSFVRMLWDENTQTLTFLSRTPSKVHTNLLKRIFKDSEVEFIKENYIMLRNLHNDIHNFESNIAEDKNIDSNKNEKADSNNENEPFRNKKINKSNHIETLDTVSSTTKDKVSDDFQKVEKKKIKKYTDSKDSKPKVRGTKTLKNSS